MCTHQLERLIQQALEFEFELELEVSWFFDP